RRVRSFVLSRPGPSAYTAGDRLSCRCFYRGVRAMLTIRGESFRLCDGINRRSFLAIGSLGLAGLSLPRVLHARESQPASRRSPRAVILYWMGGGPSHIDTYDMKPDAAAEIRGPFRPGRTRVPGMQFCELFTRQAPLADRLAIVRGLAHTTFD